MGENTLDRHVDALIEPGLYLAESERTWSGSFNGFISKASYPFEFAMLAGGFLLGQFHIIMTDRRSILFVGWSTVFKILNLFCIDPLILEQSTLQELD